MDTEHIISYFPLFNTIVTTMQKCAKIITISPRQWLRQFVKYQYKNMLLDFFTNEESRSFVFIKQIMKSYEYITHIIEVFPSHRRTENLLSKALGHDSNPRNWREFFKNNKNQMLLWSMNSPDLNSTENVYNLLKISWEIKCYTMTDFISSQIQIWFLNEEI